MWHILIPFRVDTAKCKRQSARIQFVNHKLESQLDLEQFRDCFSFFLPFGKSQRGLLSGLQGENKLEDSKLNSISSAETIGRYRSKVEADAQTNLHWFKLDFPIHVSAYFMGRRLSSLLIFNSFRLQAAENASTNWQFKCFLAWRRKTIEETLSESWFRGRKFNCYCETSATRARKSFPQYFSLTAILRNLPSCFVCFGLARHFQLRLLT